LARREWLGGTKSLRAIASATPDTWNGLGLALPYWIVGFGRYPRDARARPAAPKAAAFPDEKLMQAAAHWEKHLETAAASEGCVF